MVRADILENLKRDWPDWNIRATETLWKATRMRAMPAVPLDFFSPLGDLAQTLIVGRPRELRAALEQQDAIEAEIEASVHLDGHLVGPACPLGCLGLKPDTVRVLLTHWAATSPQRPFTAGDLVTLDETSRLEDIPGIGTAGAEEIQARLAEHALGVLP